MKWCGSPSHKNLEMKKNASYVSNILAEDNLRYRGPQSPAKINATETDALIYDKPGVKTAGTGVYWMAGTCAVISLILLAVVGLAVGGVILANVFATRADLEIHIGMDVEQLANNVPDSFINPGFSMPPDTILAVGDHSIVAMVNTAMHIMEKGTFNTIDTRYLEDSISPTSGGDPHIVWDPLSKRYFFTDFAEICNCNGAASFSSPALSDRVCATHVGQEPNPDNTMVPLTSVISGSIVATVPSDACSALSNAGDLSGNIALIARGTCTFGSKVLAAQAAGAIAVVVYDNAVGTLCPTAIMFASEPGITIPAVMISNTAGLDVVSALPTTATLTPNDTPVELQIAIGLGVSKTADPRTATTADWHYFKIGAPAWAVLGVFHDYVKISVDRTRIYITSQDFVPQPSGNFFYDSGRIVAYDKADAVAGTATVVWAEQLSSADGTSIPYPVENRWPSTDGMYQMQYFFAFNSYVSVDESAPGTPPITALRILHTDPYSADGLPLGSFDIPFGADMPEIWSDAQRTYQPLSRTDGSPSSSIVAVALPMTGVYHNGSIWIAHTYQNTGTVPATHENPNRDINIVVGRSAIKWYEIDVSRHLQEGIVSTRQVGTILPESDDAGLSMPHINVDDEGNMAIGFTISGAHEYPTVAYTGRHRSDPLNTVRYPIHRANTAPHPYDPGEIFGPGATRWGDYSGMAVDPVDGKTFYVYGEIGDASFRAGADPDICVTWTTGLAQFRFTESTTPPVHKTTPKIKHANSAEKELRTAYDTLNASRRRRRRRRTATRKRKLHAKRDDHEFEEFLEEHRMIPYGPFCNKTSPMPMHCKQVMARMGARAYDNPERPTI